MLLSILVTLFFIWLFTRGEEAIHTCGDCGQALQIVRPGKYQCVKCESK